MSQRIYDNKLDYTGLLNLSETNITDFYNLFISYTNEILNLISFKTFKIIITLYTYYTKNSTLEITKFDSYDSTKKDMLTECLTNCMVSNTRYRNNILVADKQEINIIVKNLEEQFIASDLNGDGYLTFDDFMYAVTAYPFVSRSEFESIITLTSTKLAKCVALFDVYTTSTQNIIHYDEYIVLYAILQQLGINNFTVSDVQDKCIEVFDDIIQNPLNDRKYYYFNFLQTKYQYHILNDQDDIDYTVFEFIKAVLPII
jgi:hypothetical protein